MATITNGQHGVSLLGRNLVYGGAPVQHPEGFTTEVSADGTTWGNPDQVVASLLSSISDGDIQTLVRYGNRQPVLYVRIKADTTAGLNAGEKVLAGITGRPAELVWQNPDPLAPPTVFDVVMSSMEFTFNDMSELRRTRDYVLSMSALPWGRSATKVITPAVATASATVVNSGSSATGWTAPNTASPVVSVVSGAVQVAYDGDAIGGGYDGARLRLTSTVDTDPDHYVGVDWKSSVPAYQFFLADGAGLTEVRREPGTTAGYTRSWYFVVANSGTTLELQTVHQPATGTPTLSIDQIQKSATLPNTGTARQLTRTIDPGGSVPAEGTIFVQHATAGLGHVIVFTHPLGGGYTPPLRQWLAISEPVTADSTLVSGARNALTTATKFSVPVAAIPRGSAHLWARLRRTTAGTVTGTWAVTSSIGGVTLGDTIQSTVSLNFPAANVWYLFPIARFTSPPTTIGSAGSLTIGLDAADALTQIDEAWLFGMDRGTLTVVDNGFGTSGIGAAGNRLRIAAPSLEEPQGALMAGYSADWSDAHTALAGNVPCGQVAHRFDPDGSMVFTVTSGTTDALVSFEHWPRWHSNAGS